MIDNIPTQNKIGMDRQLLQDIIEWDVDSWGDALHFWLQHTRSLADARVLEVGAGNGGLSLYFALKGCAVTCTDLQGVSHRAVELHRRYGVSSMIDYQRLDVTRMEFPSNSFDIVCFKSVLGGVGWDGCFARQQKAVQEMRRVVRPGGQVLFAENLCASALHTWLRQRFVSWGSRWRYLSVREVEDLFVDFGKLQLSTHGFFSAFGRSEGQRRFLHMLDLLFKGWVPTTARYIVFGCAEKGSSQ